MSPRTPLALIGALLLLAAGLFPFDRSLAVAVVAARAEPWTTAAFVDVTALGGYTALILVTLTGVAIAARLGRGRTARTIALALPLAAVLTEALKAATARPRPDFAPWLSHASGLSFPSGHAAESAAVYLVLAAYGARAAPRAAPVLYGAALILVVLIGLSRVVLGMHWPSDVAAGWALGGAVAFALTRRAAL